MQRFSELRLHYLFSLSTASKEVKLPIPDDLYSVIFPRIPIPGNLFHRYYPALQLHENQELSGLLR